MTAASTLIDKTPLHKAVAAVMAEVHSLKKDEKNNHGSYNYVSVDSFKNLVRPLMAKHGLSMIMSETAFELVPIQNKNGVTMNAKITYAFQIRHESGAEDDPEHATIVLPLTGAQTAGAAKSYAIKEYLKGRFLVSTGDKDLIEGGADADAYKPQDYTAPKVTPHDEPQMPSGPELLKRDEARALYTRLKGELYKLPTFREVSQWEKANELDIMKLGGWKSYMDKEIEKHLQYIEANTPREAAE